MIVGISGYVGNRLTGIGRVLINILSELAKQHPEDKYILFRNFDFKEYNCLTQYENIQIVDVPYTKESGLKNILWHQWLFQKLLKKYKCDIAYIPNFTLLLWKSIPTIVTIHDLIEYNVPDKFSKPRMIYRKWICDPLMAKRSNYILTVSEASKVDIIKYLHVNPNKITVTPNAADRTVFKKYSDEEIHRTLQKYKFKEKDYLLFVGTIDYPGKNVMTALKAYLELKKEYNIQEKMVIVGKNGYNSDVIYNFVNASESKEDIIFTGYLPEEDLPLVYAGAKIMVYLSYYEGFGLPVLEAMSCGTPVVCSNTSCFPEVIGDIDVGVNPESISEVKEKIYKLLTDTPYINSISEQCYKRASCFSWKLSAQLYHDVFKSFSN
ncbi:mannosyltransferase [Bacteroides sp. CAG:702]|nr:mannosyltransferase [Bacteroides sp. CAG:702]